MYMYMYFKSPRLKKIGLSTSFTYYKIDPFFFTLWHTTSFLVNGGDALIDLLIQFYKYLVHSFYRMNLVHFVRVKKE